MPKAIISDTSCIILLDKIGELDILGKLFGTIITTSEVAEEFGQPLPSWFQIRQPGNKNYQSLLSGKNRIILFSNDWMWFCCQNCTVSYFPSPMLETRKV